METEFKKILIAVDDSAFSMKAAKTGFSIAHMARASVAIVYVVDRSKEVVNADLGMMPEESRSVLLGEAEKTIEQFIKLYDGKGEVFRFTPTGIPEEEILNIAEQWGADMIVMGTHGRSAVGRVLNGSTAEYVVRRAKIPVLLTPPKM